LGSGEELLEAERVIDLDAMFLKDLFVVPKDVTPVHPDQHGVNLTSFADLIEQALGHDSVPTLTLVKDGDRNAVTRLNVLAEEFVTRMGLPGVGWVTRCQAVLQYGPSR
jgi:hypothetical protein